MKNKGPKFLLGLFFAPTLSSLALTYPIIQESQTPEELTYAQSIADTLTETIRSSNPRLRGAHAKHHGCVQGTFTVESSLPKEFQVGVFQPQATYPTWVRFSNGSHKSQNDQDKDARGMAIKLEELNQDFVMINHPVFFAKNPHDMAEFVTKSKTSGMPLSFFFPSINPMTWRLKEMGILYAIANHSITNPLASSYWSATPYAMGKHAAKFSVSPCKEAPLISFDQKDPNFLRLVMEEHLKTEGTCFDFFVQMQTNSETMPIEDATVEWSEKESPYVKVATLQIPKQTFNTPTTNEFCENLSFAPWHARPEHRPLGGINRLRKIIYEASSATRHDGK